MLSKKIAFLLFGIIAILTVLFGFNIYISYQKKQTSEEKINTIINKFEEKFKSDSIYLAKANKMLIDKISQKIIDSISIVYEDKLKATLETTNRYKKLLIANNIPLDEIPNKKIRNNSIHTEQKSEEKTEEQIKRTESKTKLYREVVNNVQVITSNNVTPAFQKEKQRQKKNIATNTQTFNNTSKLKSKLETNNLTTIKSTDKIHNPFKISHNNNLLDSAENINEINQTPIYPGCEHFQNNTEQRKCFATKISRHILDNFNNQKAKNNTERKGLNKVRVLFIINKNGEAKFGKLVGKWSDEVYKEAKSAVESVPKMKPGRNKNSNVSVKYSLLIPFIN